MNRTQGEPVYFCSWCELTTTHPSHTCPEHREFAPPLPGLDAPYAEDDDLRGEVRRGTVTPRADRRLRPGR